MSIYRITATIHRCVRTEIEAESLEEAEEMAYGVIDEKYDNDNIYIDDVVEILREERIRNEIR